MSKKRNALIRHHSIMISNFNYSDVLRAAPLLAGVEYVKPYLQLKSYQTMLSSCEIMINKNIQHCSQQEKDTLSTLLELVYELKKSRLGRIFDVCNGIVPKIRSIVNQDGLSNNVKRPCSFLLRITLSILRLPSMFISKKSQDNNTQEVTKKVRSRSISSTAICRICNEKVPLHLLEEHTKYCISAYKNETMISEINEKIKEVIKHITSTTLYVEWPAPREAMIHTLIPNLHLAILLAQAYFTDQNSYGSQEDLNYIFKQIKSIQLNGEYSELIKKSYDLVHEKTRISLAFQMAAQGLQSTRVSGSSKPVTEIIPKISDFEFVKRVSAGAFGSVFIAKKKATGDIYAIKAIPKSSLTQKNQTRRIFAEKDLMLLVQSPYIVTFYYSITGCKNLYLVTEYVPGGDLYSLLQNVGCFDEDTARIYYVEIVEALRYLRNNGIIHRDIKPDNILISGDGHLKLTDFGLSFQGVVDRQDVEDVEVVGTPDYIAPEILMNKVHTFSVDYWSLGAMLYEFLYGVPPFHGADEQETAAKIVTCEYSFDDDQNDDQDIHISDEAKDLIKKLLELNPKERLGAKCIDDLLAHPWVQGLRAETADPPFKPELQSATDTGYFEQRYQFQKVDDADILEDFVDGSQPIDLNEWQSASVQSLVRSNERIISSSSTSSFQLLEEEDFNEMSPLVTEPKKPCATGIGTKSENFSYKV